MDNEFILIPAKRLNLWGYLNTNGEWAISPRFDAAWDFEECGIARVAIDNKVRIIDKSGKFVGNCRFDALSNFDKYGIARTEKNNKWSIVGINGKYLTQNKFDTIGSFSCNGLAVIKKNGLYGYINKSGEIVIKPQFYNAMDFNDNGYAAVKTCKRWQIINQKGEFVTKPLFDRVIGFSENDTSVVVVDDKWGHINCCGEYIIQPQYLYADSFGNSNLATVKCNGELIVINPKGEVVLGPFTKYRYMDFNYMKSLGVIFAAGFNGLYSVLDITGKPITDAQYENYDFVEIEGNILLFVQQNKKWGLLNNNFEEIILPRFTSYRTEFFGIICESYDHFTYINYFGKIIADKFKSFKYASEHLLIQTKGKWLSVDKNGNVENVADLESLGYYPSWIKVEIDEIHLPHWGFEIDTRSFFTEVGNDYEVARGYNLYNF